MDKSGKTVIATARTRRRWRYLIGFCVIAGLVLSGVVAARKILGEMFRVDCSNNYKQVGLILRMYANESEGNVFPPLGATPGELLFEVGELVPDYWPEQDPKWLLSYHEGIRSRTQNTSQRGSSPPSDFYYLGYAIADEKQMAAFDTAYRKRIAEGRDFTEDLPVAAGAGTWGGDTLLRLSTETTYAPEGAESYRGAPDQHTGKPRSIVPLAIEKLGHYNTPGAYVLYADGYVEFIEYPGKWPVTATTMGLLQKLDSTTLR